MKPPKNRSAFDPTPVSRRAFLQGMGALGGATLLLGGQAPAPAGELAASLALPRRKLGRTNHEVTALSLGTWPCGKSEGVDTAGVMTLVREALELGINMIDTARLYGKAEEAIGKALGNRRDQVFLATKVWADTAEEARVSLEESLRTLRTDHVDLVYLHSLGNRDPQRAQDKDGALTYLLEQKKTGKTRFVGISGHSKVQSFVPVLETGQIDVVLMAMNFVDRHTYGFEETVLPVARRHNVGVVCMKVFGGTRGGFAGASRPNPGPEVELSHLEKAVRYAMGLPGVGTLVIGPHTVEHLRQNARWVANYKPLSAEEHGALLTLGRELAQRWGPHYGPVA